MKIIQIILIASIVFLPSLLLANDGYFPPKIFSDRQDLHEFKCNLFLKYLKVLDEPSIYKQRSNKQNNIFRFTWLRTFDYPISIRLEIKHDGTGLIFAKVSDGKGGYYPGNILTNVTKNISKDMTAEFVALLENNKFENIPSTVDEMGLDGSHWIIEGLSNGNYHLAERWAPESGAIREIGLLLLKFSGLKVDNIY